MREPDFWGRPAGVAAGLLSPIAAIYAAAAAWRMARRGRAAGIPVICIGNLTVGGAGKTPTAMAVAQLLQASGRRPFLLSRGYGGALAGPVLVDPAKLTKNLSIAVVDARRGIGNGMVCPAGPLRAPLESQLRHVHAVLLIGSGTGGEPVAAAARAHGLPVFHGRLAPDQAALDTLKGRPVLAFAGIGDPEKFYATLREAGIDVCAQRSFPDHHRFRSFEAIDLIARAERDGLIPVTTEKDQVRLAGQDDLTALAGIARVLPVKLAVAEDGAFRDFVLARAA
jgi:tetraacyldisaccharide 4'-kinase